LFVAREKVSQALRDAYKAAVAGQAEGATVHQDGKVYERLDIDFDRSSGVEMPSAAILPSKLPIEPNESQESAFRGSKSLLDHLKTSRKRPASSLPIQDNRHDQLDSQRAASLYRKLSSFPHLPPPPTTLQAAINTAPAFGIRGNILESAQSPSCSTDVDAPEWQIGKAELSLFSAGSMFSAHEQLANQRPTNYLGLNQDVDRSHFNTSNDQSHWPVLPREAEPDEFPPDPHPNPFLALRHTEGIAQALGSSGGGSAPIDTRAGGSMMDEEVIDGTSLPKEKGVKWKTPR
jgi:hypothetical protein